MAENKKKVDSYGNVEGEPTAYDGYEEALRAFQERGDIETLDSRRKRTQGADFDEAHFVREGEAEGVVITASTNGSDADQMHTKVDQDHNEQPQEASGKPAANTQNPKK